MEEELTLIERAAQADTLSQAYAMVYTDGISPLMARKVRAAVNALYKSRWDAAMAEANAILSEQSKLSIAQLKEDLGSIDPEDPEGEYLQAQYIAENQARMAELQLPVQKIKRSVSDGLTMAEIREFHATKY